MAIVRLFNCSVRNKQIPCTYHLDLDLLLWLLAKNGVYGAYMHNAVSRVSKILTVCLYSPDSARTVWVKSSQKCWIVEVIVY